MRCDQGMQDFKVRKSHTKCHFSVRRIPLLGRGQSSPLCFVQPAHGRERHVTAKIQHTILVCCKGQSLGTVFSVLIVCSHHPPSHGDYKRVEISSGQMQTLLERAVYFPLTGAGSVLIRTSEYLLRNKTFLCCINSIFPLSCLTYICFLCLASFHLLCV